ncbi:MAG TPA: Lsr2 family protein [Streptosporangiaceae bacterium]|nr:Lsr2 family protein [Streptosporangiaceae bacterium]
MSQKVTVSLQDDLDGSPAAETVRFALSGSEFEIDLSERNARKFRQQIDPFVERARRAGRRVKARPVSRSVASRQRTARIRAWARQHGMAINDRGRIPTRVIEEYQAAGQKR